MAARAVRGVDPGHTVRQLNAPPSLLTIGQRGRRQVRAVPMGAEQALSEAERVAMGQVGIPLRAERWASWTLSRRWRMA
jgi:hypothetical protein